MPRARRNDDERPPLALAFRHVSLADKLFTGRILVQARIVGGTRPDRLMGALRQLRRWGPTPAAGYSANAIRHPDAIAVIDELGSLTFADMHRRSNALAHA